MRADRIASIRAATAHNHLIVNWALGSSTVAGELLARRIANCTKCLARVRAYIPKLTVFRRSGKARESCTIMFLLLMCGKVGGQMIY